MDSIMWIIGIVAVVFFIFVLVMIPFAIKHDSKMMDECLKDHKEYECMAMLHGRAGYPVGH